MKNLKYKKGFTLIETMIGVALFVMISTATYFSYSNILDIVIAAQLNSAGLTILSNEIETIRNMPYEDVGTIGGAPSGPLLQERTVNFAGLNFILKTTIRNIDHPFDGTLGGSPNDLAPADNKLVELEVSCPECQRFIPATVTTTVAPLNLEVVSNNGSMFVNVYDASGEPVGQATVRVVNNSVNPAINIIDSTNNNGSLQLVDIATSSLGYEVTITKSGYSSDKTYTPGAPANPNPIKPHATVLEQQVTNISFTIDKVSTVNFKAQDYFCAGIPDFDFSLVGTKLIGTSPDVLKYSQAFTTIADGTSLAGSLEWDSYTMQNTDANFNLAGSSIESPLILNPDVQISATWNVEPKDPNALLVSVRDQNNLLTNDATIILTKPGFSQTAITGRKQISFTDWSSLGYSAISSNIDAGNSVSIANVSGAYASQSDEWLESETVDFGNSSAQFYNLRFNPISQNPQTSMRIQIASNNDNSVWNYVGPDGSPAAYYDTSDTAIWPGHNSSRYLRYKIWLRTDDENVTPQLDDISFEFGSSCVVAGNHLFSNLSNGSYTITVQKAGFQDAVVPVDVLSAFQEVKINLVP